MSTDAYLERLKAGILKVHGAEAEYIETIPVKETFHGEIVWDGNVEVFRLVDHPAADICYAWAYKDDGKELSTAVLKLPPVISPETAVRAAIAALSLQRVKDEFALGIKSSDEKQATMTPEQCFQSGLKNSQNVHRGASPPHDFR